MTSAVDIQVSAGPSLANILKSPWANWKMVLGGGVLLLMILLEFIGPLFWDTEMARTGSVPTNMVPVWIEADKSLGFKDGSAEHPLGSESTGRDMLALLLVATPRSLKVGLIAATIGTLIGIILGFASGFLGGWFDSVVRILSDAWMTIPGLAVLIVIASYVEEFDINSMALVIAMFSWPGPTRVIRAQVLSMRERGYVQMAQLSGASTFKIMFMEMMPNLLPYLAATYTAAVSAAILAATGLEILGLGPTRIPTLGMTISNALRASAILRGMWWWWGFPIIMLVVIFISLFLMTIGLDEIANPRLRGAGRG
ncbi:MAG: ABC transporter permease [Chloroflexi bacterium]|nr:ABC transporter permease [Chloroflexota bacterium]